MREMEHLLAGLSASLDTAGRLGLLAELVEAWHGPVSRERGITAEALDGVRMPSPLRWWYGRFGRDERLMGVQNRVLPLEALGVDEDADRDDPRLVFYE